MEIEIEGTTVQVRVEMPSESLRRHSEKVYDRVYQKAVSAGASSRKKVQAFYAKSRAAVKERQHQDLLDALQADEKVLADALISVEHRRVVAERMRRMRAEATRLVVERGELERLSAEAKATQAQFDYLVYACTRRIGGEAYFANVKQFQKLRGEDHPVAVKAHHTLARALLGIRHDYEECLPENVFLREHTISC